MELKGHGTVAAYKRHLRDGTEPCDACKGAQALAMSSYRAQKPRDRTADMRAARARRRALKRLVDEHPVRFGELLAEEQTAP